MVRRRVYLQYGMSVWQYYGSNMAVLWQYYGIVSSTMRGTGYRFQYNRVI